MYTRVLAVIAGLLAVHFLIQRYFSGLSKFNGPLLASITPLWQIWYEYTHSQEQNYVDIHHKYGDIVRIAPNELSFADPAAIHDIYGPKGSVQKSEVYSVPSAPVNGVMMDVLFSTMNPTWHDRQRRILNPTMSMSQLKTYEPWVDDTVKAFMAEWIKRFADKQNSGEPVDLIKWFAYFSLDAASDITFGERSGFIESASDIDGTISLTRQMMQWWPILVHVPTLDKIINKNPVILWFNRRGWFLGQSAFSAIVKRQFFERQEYWKTREESAKGRLTVVDKLLAAKKAHPEVPDFNPFIHSMSIVGAATESMTITTSSIFYYLLKNPRCYKKLQSEIEELDVESNIPLPYSVAQKLPYLDAVIKESMRCHWITRIPLTRVTPPGGMTICGVFVPGGVNVGVTGPAVHHNSKVFGPDVNVFRPERWLEDKGKARQMQNAMFTFGSGKYACLGVHLATLELLKIVPTLIRNFEFHLIHPNKDWVLRRGAFIVPDNLMVRVKARD